jgi:hypothetical protein
MRSTAAEEASGPISLMTKRLMRPLKGSAAARIAVAPPIEVPIQSTLSKPISSSSALASAA